MDDQLSFVVTADGSKTIYNPQVGENYHSRHGALQESRHVFLNAGLLYLLNQTGRTEASVLEVGFGTGLNFLISAAYCEANDIKLNYTGIEAYPLGTGMISDTGYDQYVDSSLWLQFTKCYATALVTSVSAGANCRLQIAHCALNNYKSGERYDVIYFDAFAAARQPEMWEEQAIAHTIQFLKPGGVFVTYAITGNLKRTLKSLGCIIEKVPGAAGKREMLRAVKLTPALMVP